VPRPDDTRPTPITLANLIWWAARTYAWDRRRYRAKAKRLSLRRLVGVLRPNLRAPLFIIGADRSGTTFLGDCIATLPEISYHHEPEVIKAAARYVFEGRWGFRRARAFFRLVYGWLMRIHLDGHLRFAEKTPTNSFIVPFLARAFPDAVFVHIVRDGRDAAASHLEQPWLLASSLASGRREPGGYRHGPDARFWVEPDRRADFESTTDVHRVIWSWRRHTEAALDGRGLPAARYLELRYEDLVQQPTALADRLADFLDLDSEESRAGLRAAMAHAQATGVGRWQERFSDAELAVIDAEAGDLLRRLSYEQPAVRATIAGMSPTCRRQGT
jgi:LPS sulfotransferase NodH